MKTAIILGSSRSQGNTSALAQVIRQELSSDYFDLNDFNIAPFCYDNNYQDDFAELINTLLGYQRLIFASPIYWYSASGPMKIFLDRLTDLLSFDKDKGRLLRGKSAALIATGADTNPPDCFEQAFAMSFRYLGITYEGMSYCYCNDEFDLRQHNNAITDFVEKLKLSTFSTTFDSTLDT